MEEEPIVCKKSEVIQILERVPSRSGRSLDRLPAARTGAALRSSDGAAPGGRPSPRAAGEKSDVAPAEDVAASAVVVSLKVRCLDKTVRHVMLDLRFSGLEAGLQVGRELRVTLINEFGLAFPDKGGWLDEELALLAQGITAVSELVYKKKFFVADEELTPRDEVDVGLMYPQCVDGLLHGSFKCSQTHAVGLAALQAVVTTAEGKNGPSVSELAELLPPDMRNGAAVKCVMDQLEGMQALSAAEARFQLVHICSLLPGYGVSAYVVGDTSARRSVAISSLEKTPVLLGVSREGISRMSHKTRECLELYQYSMLESWAAGRQTFVCDFGSNRTQGQWGVSTRSGRVIAQLITGYQRLLKERNKLK